MELLHEAQVGLLKSRPCEKILADYCSSALLKALKFNLISLKKEDDQASTEMHKSDRNFSHGLDLSQRIKKDTTSTGTNK